MSTRGIRSTVLRCTLVSSCGSKLGTREKSPAWSKELICTMFCRGLWPVDPPWLLRRSYLMYKLWCFHEAMTAVSAAGWYAHGSSRKDHVFVRNLRQPFLLQVLFKIEILAGYPPFSYCGSVMVGMTIHAGLCFYDIGMNLGGYPNMGHSLISRCYVSVFSD